MQARTFALAALLLGSAAAHAQYGGMMNPMTMMNPMAMANPMAMMNPMAMVAPMGMMAAPMVLPLGANMMSAQMYNPQAMMNPYLNPMAAGNPYLNPNAGMNPFAMMQQPSAGYGMPAAAPMPFFPPMPTAPAPTYGGYAPSSPAPAQAAPMPFFPMMPPAPTASAPAAPAVAAPQAAAPAGNPFDPAMWMQMMGGMMPAAPAATPAPEAAK